MRPIPAPTVQQSCAATGVSRTGATLSAVVNPNGPPTSWRFEYGGSTAYGQQTPTQTLGPATTNETVSAILTGLTPGATYHCRLVATSAGGATDGADQIFATSAKPRPPRRRGAALRLGRVHLAALGRGCMTEHGRVRIAHAATSRGCDAARLTFTGRIARSADGERLTLRLRSRRGERTITLTVRPRVAGGRWRATLTLPGRDVEPSDRWTLTISYRGNRRLRAATVTGGFLLEVEIFNRSGI